MLLGLAIAGISFQACNRFDNNDDQPLMEDMVIDQSFDWETSTEVTFRIIAKDNQDQALENVKISAYTDDPENGGDFIFLTGR